MERAEKDLSKNINKFFILFLILHLLLWSALPLIREILPIDALECIYWGGLHDFGTNKHPPFAAWIAYYIYRIFKSDFSIYFLGQFSIIVGFVYLYKLGKIFLDNTKAILSVMILEACFVFTYMGIYDGFNPNFLLLSFFPIIAYYFYKSTHEDKLINWLKLGIFVGLSFLSKYQTLMLFLPLFGYLVLTDNGKKQFRKKGLYISAVLAFLIMLPHIIWLFKNEFFSLNYFILCEDNYATFFKGPFKYVYAPFHFLINQFAAIAGTIFIYFTAYFIFKNKEEADKNIDTRAFLVCAGIVPLFLQTLSCLNGNYAIPQWGYVTLYMSGILLFYYFPFKISDGVIKYIISWVYAAMFITSIVLFAVFSTEKNFANRLSVSQVTEQLNTIYKSATGQDMKYIGGFIELSIPINIYNNGKYTVILNTYDHKNIWINNEDLRKNGVIVVGRNYYYMEDYIDSSAPNLVTKPSINPFILTVKNAIGREREYIMYYAIVSPNAEYKDQP